MALFEFHIHNQVDLEEVNKKLDHLLKHQHELMGQLDDIKAKLALQDTAINGLQADLDFIKGKLANVEGGLTADEVAELNTLIDERTAKLQALDNQTDPNA